MARGKHNGNGHERLHITETPDVSHIKNLDVTHEASDVSVSGVAKFVLALTIMCAAVFVLMWGMFRLLNAQEAEKDPPAGPMAMKPDERLPPPPRLQAAPGFEVKLKNGEIVSLEKKEPEAEYRVLRAQWENELNCSAGPDRLTRSDEHENSAPSPSAESDSRARLTLCTPIKEAMEKVVGLPSRVKTTSTDGAAAPAADSGIDRPTAASSGRMTERGKQ